MKRGYKKLVGDAVAAVNGYSPSEAISRLTDDDVAFVDVRDAPELVEHGETPDTIHASRGMLEFHIDPDSPYFIEEFGADKEFIFNCTAGSRAALAAHRAKEMGLERVAYVEGGFNAWVEAGGPILEPQSRM
jgi:rhodanese-related sulfurtransferase